MFKLLQVLSDIVRGSRSEIALLMHLVPTGSMCFIISANLTDGDLNPLHQVFFSPPPPLPKNKLKKKGVPCIYAFRFN